MKPILELRRVSKAYEGFALRDVSFTLPRGYIMGLVGPNGAGKTTLVKLILNLVRRESGEIRVFGLDNQRDEVAIRSRIGFVHERPVFHDYLSIERAVACLAPFYPKWDDATFHSLAAEFGLPLKKRVRALSRGMRTRLALAVALAHEAELLLLDEPSSGLDPVFRRDLLDRLSGVIEGGESSVLFSTHITSDLDRIADYVTFVQAGRLVLSTTQDRILEDCALVKGGRDLLTEEVRRLLAGWVETEVGFTGLTRDVRKARARFAGESVVFDKVTLEDVMFYTGRAGRRGVSPW
jgi:ABC-2 type transport system ATP-binding protein